MKQLLYETHLHTPLCKHARGEPGQYAEVAEARGMTGIIVTCHNPLPGGLASPSRMAAEQFDDYLALVAEARDQYQGRIDVRLGLECDFIPEFEPWLKRQTASAPFDYLLGSVHPHIPYYKERYWKGDPVAFQRGYFGHLADAAETGLFDSLAHPDLVKNVTAGDWQVQRVLDDIRRSLDRIAAAGVAMELNTSGLNKAVPEMNPGPVILREMRERNIPVTVGSDAHDAHRVADRWEQAFDLLEAVGYRHISVFLERQRHDILLTEARSMLVDLDAAGTGKATLTSAAAAKKPGRP